MESWNGLDFFVFLILLINTLRGMSRGGGKELIALMCLSAALIICIKFTVPLANFLNKSPLIISVVKNQFIANFFNSIGAGPLTADVLKQIMYSISLLLCFVSVFSVTEATIYYSGYVQTASLTQAVVSKKLGAAIGFTRGYILSLIFLSIITLHIFKDSGGIAKEFIDGSFFVRVLSTPTIMLDDMISSKNPVEYQKLYKDKPYSESDLIRLLKDPSSIEDK
ncbi:CvpA family protein [Gammaproteobacteria bacterium]|nr:CvpA family protein [Gammaproteobacteria bacterium]